MEFSAFIESFLFHEDNKIYWSPSHFGLSYRSFVFGNAPLHGWVVEDLTPPLSLLSQHTNQYQIFLRYFNKEDKRDNFVFSFSPIQHEL